MSITIDVELEKQKDRFRQALYASKGKTNNSFAWSLVTNSDATVEDIVRLGTRSGNSNYYGSYIALRNRYNQQELNRLLKQSNSKQNSFLRLTDYKWFFNNAKMDDIDSSVKITPTYNKVTDVVYETMKSVLETNREMTYEGRRALAYKIMTDIVYGSDYFNKNFIERIDNDNLGDWHTTLRNRVMKFSLDNNRTSLDFLHYGYNLTKCPRSVIKQILELCDKITYSELIMNSYIGSNQDNKDENNLSQVYTKKYISNWDQTKKVDNKLLTLMKVNGTYKMLLDMGIAWVKTDWRQPTYKDMARVHTRVRSMYKNFTKAKTVEQREATRKLMVEQLNLIAHDFGNSHYKFEQMSCTTWQDEEFKNNSKNNKESKPNVKGLPKGTKIDISELKFDLV